MLRGRLVIERSFSVRCMLFLVLELHDGYEDVPCMHAIRGAKQTPHYLDDQQFHSIIHSHNQNATKMTNETILVPASCTRLQWFFGDTRSLSRNPLSGCLPGARVGTQR